MAKVTTVTDDLDGSPGAETIRIRIGDDACEIDLAPKNRAKLDELLKPYFAKGREIKVGVSNSDVAKMREWLKANGHNPGEKGRIAGDLQDLYHRANPQG